MMNNILNKIKKISNSNIAFDGMMLTLVRCITLATSILQTMLLSRMLSLTEYGVYSQLLIVVSITTTFSALGLSNAINYFYNKNNGNKKDMYVNHIFLITIISGILGALICFIFRYQIADYYSTPLVAGLMIYIIFKPLLDNILNLYTPLYISMKKTKIIAIRNLVIAILKVILVPLAFYITKSIKWMFIIQIILDILQIIYFTLLVKCDINFKNIKINKKVINEILKYSIPLALATMMGTLFKESDKLVVAKLMNIEQLAVYTNMSKQLPFEFISLSFTSVIMPIIVRLLDTDRGKCIKLWKVFLEFSYIISWILCFGAIICSRELLIVLYSIKYIDGLGIFIIYLVTELFRFTFFGLILSASGKTKFITISSLVSLIANILLNIILYYIIGFSGPAVATLISVIIMNYLQLHFSCKLLKIKILDLFNLKNVLLFMFKLIVIGILCIILKLFCYKLTDSELIIFIMVYSLYIIVNFYLSKDQIINLVKKLK